MHVDRVAARRRGLERAGWAAVDVACWLLGMLSTVWLRYDFAFPEGALALTLVAGTGMAGLQVLLGSVFGPYRIGHDRGSYEETSELARTTLLTTAVAFVVIAGFRPDDLPRSSAVTGGSLALLAMFAARLLGRSTSTRAARERPDSHRALIFGAGNAGRRLVRSALREHDSHILPVALLDDDPAKARLRIEGVPVCGGKSDVARVADQRGASVLVLAAPSADPDVTRTVSEQAVEAGLSVKVLPSLSEMIGDDAPTDALRDLDLADLLGRRPIHLDTHAISRDLAGRRVLVTGAGGSIGSELCRQIARFGPERLFLLDRDESALQATQLSLTGDGLLDDDDALLVDIRDEEALHAVLARTRPDVVFHAAALKHLPLLERFPTEAWKTNVLGTLNVLRAASACGVEVFVNVSTDKAADPSSCLGYSKRLTERLTAEFANAGRGRYVSVRFGNVLGSRGSVVHAFTAQIERGGPVTVTDPSVKRYFMLIPEACQLVLEAAAVGTDGEVLVLDMGHQVLIADVASTLIRLSGRADVEIVYTGLRSGEKMGEDLFSDREHRRATIHPLVAAVAVPPLSAADVQTRRFAGEHEALEWMRQSSTFEVAPSEDPVSTVSKHPTDVR